MITKADKQLLVVFGASGDLAKRKLMPSLFELYLRDLLPDDFVILGASRTQYSDEQYRQAQKDFISSHFDGDAPDAQKLDAFLQMAHYVYFDTEDCAQYSVLKDAIAKWRAEKNIPDRVLYYLGTPPVMFAKIPECLKAHGLNKPDSAEGWRRIIVEKPFGHDLQSALDLNAQLRSIFQEKEIYRIDHYLGKETVQNMLVLRFANGIFEPLWNRNYVYAVEISTTEQLGVEKRGGYYEKAGAMRDMVQNHLMQLMSFVAMEAPSTFDPEAIRDETAKVFKTIRHYAGGEIDKHVVRGQYVSGKINDQGVPAYRDEEKVSQDSNTETYVAAKIMIDNWRWGGVPFYLYTGKRMPDRKAEVVIHFKSTPQQLFKSQCTGPSCNKLTIRIQPDEGIALRFGFKEPGAGFDVRQVSMDFRYDSVVAKHLPDAYERLLLDAMKGDGTLFARSDALEASWSFVDPILNHWKEQGETNLQFYAAGSHGPDKAVELMEDIFYPGHSCPYEGGDDIRTNIAPEG